MKQIKTGDDSSAYASGNYNCKTSTTGTSIPKQKPKELDCWDKVIIPSHHVLWAKEDESTGGVTVCVDIKKIIENVLTQQRIELENQKVKVVWNDVCEQIKQEARTELLEEIMKIIEVNVHVGSGYTDECDKNQLIEEIKKL